MNRRLSRSFWFLVQSVIAWAISLGLFILIHRVGTDSTLGWRPDNLSMLVLWGIASLLFGFAFWLINVLVESTSLRSQSFGILILAKSLAMVAALICYTVFRGLGEILLSDSTTVEAIKHCIGLLFSPFAGVVLLYVGVTSVAFNFVREMSAMVGQRVLINLLLGKYRNPRAETRIFMFLDLKGSTTIAERLGHEEFFRLIQECFRDLTESAIQCNVEIYQYVGDEAILTWTPDRGLEDCNCLRVFFQFKETLQCRADFYIEQFDVLPEFKAGANLGPTTVAEIGILKRDIAYLSDVLNTAARLESMCRQHDAELLITESLKEALPDQEEIDCDLIGDLELRGKNEKIRVYRVELSHSRRYPNATDQNVTETRTDHPHSSANPSTTSQRRSTKVT